MAETKHTYLAFGEKHADTYKKLGELLGKLTNRDQFLLALSWGFQSGTNVEDFKRSGNGVRVDYLKDEDRALISAIHLAETCEPESLSDVDAGFTLAEQYAEGGILLLAQVMEEHGDFSRKLSGQVKSQLDALAFDEQ